MQSQQLNFLGFLNFCRCHTIVCVEYREAQFRLRGGQETCILAVASMELWEWQTLENQAVYWWFTEWPLIRWTVTDSSISSVCLGMLSGYVSIITSKWFSSANWSSLRQICFYWMLTHNSFFDKHEWWYKLI